jgi:hypothetical protein
MVAVILTITGILALLFYVMHLVKPKRVKLSAKVFKLVEFNVEADSVSDDAGQPKAKQITRRARKPQVLPARPTPRG